MSLVPSCAGISATEGAPRHMVSTGLPTKSGPIVSPLHDSLGSRRNFSRVTWTRMRSRRSGIRKSPDSQGKTCTAFWMQSQRRCRRDASGTHSKSRVLSFSSSRRTPKMTLLGILLHGDIIGLSKLIIAHINRHIEVGNPFALANRNGAVREFAVTQSILRQSRGTPAQPDIMQKLLRVHDLKPRAFNDDAVRSMVATNVFGGAETTASSIRAVIYFLLKDRTAMAKLQQEIDQTCHEHLWPSDVPVALNVAESMKYLQAVAYESMRLFPANGLPLARVSPPEELEINGHYFPPGVQLTVYSWALHRNKRLFGEDAMEFEPERWLDGERSHDLHWCFFSFGYGSRACLGRNLAWMEMLKAISTFFRRYAVHLQDPSATWVVECAFIKGQKNINVLLNAR